jgi:hypothetical protein
MTKTLIAAAVLSAVVLASLTGCSVGVIEPSAGPAAGPTSSTPTVTAEPDADTEVGGQFTSGVCDGRDLELTQDETVVILTGTCGTVTVSGKAISVNLENVRSLIVDGAENTVIVSGDVEAVTLSGELNFFTGGTGGTVRSLEISGDNNTITGSVIDSVTIPGSSNFVTWSGGATSATDTGIDNVIVAPSGQLP